NLLEVYNSEKRQLDLLKIKHKHVQKAFMGSYDRFRALHRHTIELRKDMAACENALMEAEQDSLDCGAASREADREMAECIERLKETSAKMGEKWEVVKGFLYLAHTGWYWKARSDRLTKVHAAIRMLHMAMQLMQSMNTSD
ncbi:unnamed protein product, partial [Microthlaspi erraticum]